MKGSGRVINNHNVLSFSQKKTCFKEQFNTKGQSGWECGSIAWTIVYLVEKKIIAKVVQYQITEGLYLIKTWINRWQNTVTVSRSDLGLFFIVFIFAHSELKFSFRPRLNGAENAPLFSSNFGPVMKKIAQNWSWKEVCLKLMSTRSSRPQEPKQKKPYVKINKWISFVLYKFSVKGSNWKA